jgi:hypothetical protein
MQSRSIRKITLRIFHVFNKIDETFHDLGYASCGEMIYYYATFLMLIWMNISLYLTFRIFTLLLTPFGFKLLLLLTFYATFDRSSYSKY